MMKSSSRQCYANKEVIARVFFFFRTLITLASSIINYIVSKSIKDSIKRRYYFVQTNLLT